MIILDSVLYVFTLAIGYYIWLIIIGAVLSWLVAFNIINTSNQLVYLILDFLNKITEPVLRPIQKFLPNFGGVDLSPVVLILFLIFLEKVIGDIRLVLA